MGSWPGKHWLTAVGPSHRMTQLLREEIEGEAHSMVIESGRVRASIQSDG